MYRTRSPENSSQGESEQFVEKLRDLPVVTDALGKLGALYTGTKEHNRLFRFTLQTAESGLGLVYSTAKPIVNKFEKPIGTLNGIACNQLDRLEQDYPIIAQPTEEVLKRTKETYVKPIADRVKPITDRVGSVAKYGADKVQNAKQFTVGKIEGVTNYGLNKVNDVKTYSVNKVLAASDAGQKQMNRMLDNHASQLLIAQVGLIINVADGYVDKYLPPDETDDKSPKNKKPESETPQGAVINQAWNIGSKVRRRAYNRAAKELKAVRMRSVDTLSKMNPVDLLEYARTNIDGMRGKVHYVWDEINKPAEEVAKEDTESEKNRKNLTYERRFIATARHITMKLKAGAASLNLSIEAVPGPFRPYVLQALEVVQSVFRYFLARPEHMGRGAETKSSVPSIKSSPAPPATSSPAKSQSQQHQKGSVATTKKPDTDENNRDKAKKSPAASPAAVAPPVTKDSSESKKAGEEKIERSLSSSSSEHQDDQAYAEPQDDSPDSYE